MIEKNKAEYAGKTVEIIPDYANLSKMFLKDFVIQSGCLREMPAETHVEVHSLLASLNVAIQAIDSNESLTAVRDRLSSVVTSSNEQLNRKREAAGDENDE